MTTLVGAAAPTLRETTLPLRAGPPLDNEDFAVLRRKMTLDACKWDPQVGDTPTLARFPLFIPQDVWRQLAGRAEQMTFEALTAEQEILSRPDLLDTLGLSRTLRRLFRAADHTAPTPAAARVMRFDFHFTTEGWRISEVNSDVPGGFTEASAFPHLMSAHFPGARMAGNPIAAWTRAIAASAGEGGLVALLSAPGFMEDHQIIAYLARHLRDAGCRVRLAGPEQIIWREGRAFLTSTGEAEPVAAIVRFYQGEWFAGLRRKQEWAHFFIGGLTPVGNPGIALISESKRFPLVWDELRTPMTAWRRLLPETRDPREVNWAADDSWLLKTAFCNTGDTVSIRSALDPRKWRAASRAARWHPGRWLAQKRFETVPVTTPLGPVRPCIGVYTINGKAAGAYARVSARAVIDYAAVDVPLLLCDD